MDSTTLPRRFGPRFSQYIALTKPRVTQLAVFCAVIGMFLSTPGMVPWRILIGGTIGIWLLAAAAFAINCLVELKLDAMMRRTAWRPSARGEITPVQILMFSSGLGGLGIWTLFNFTNALTMWLTLATFAGYAIIYTLLLKPATPQNIVIGGASGAMPPALGWAAVNGHVPGDAWILVLIIFVWTPPHFWALAFFRRKEYEKAGIPILPNTHGEKYTRLHVLLYTALLFAVTMMPFISGMSGIVYLVAAMLLGAIFLAFAWKMYREYSDALSRKTFHYSIVYLSLLFASLLVDHYTHGLIGAYNEEVNGTRFGATAPSVHFARVSK
jgi:heme o synthase